MTRFGYVVMTYFTALAVGLSAFLHPTPRLIWNASANVPIGLYALRPAGVLHVTDLVVIKPPEPLGSFLADRGYLPKGVPLLKRVLALPGQTVCRTDRTVTVDGISLLNGGTEVHVDVTITRPVVFLASLGFQNVAHGHATVKLTQGVTDAGG